MDFIKYRAIEKEAHRICNEIIEKAMKEREDIIKIAWEEYQKEKNEGVNPNIIIIDEFGKEI